MAQRWSPEDFPADVGKEMLSLNEKLLEFPYASEVPDEVENLIIGSGPTGLGAATRFQMSGKDFFLIDQANDSGGLATTDVTPEGFLFDMGGHVIFSHFDYFDQLVDAAYGSEPEKWAVLQRVSYVQCKGKWVAYPFQNNICQLPVKEQIDCLAGLVDAKLLNASGVPPTNFDEWIMRTQGPGLAELFMRPYNYRVWAVPTHLMQCKWLGERVATADVRKAIGNVLRGEEDAGWGPNAIFRFPTEGGTGAIWKQVSRKCVDVTKQCFGMRVVAIDLAGHTVTLQKGSTDKAGTWSAAEGVGPKVVKYKKMMSTIPLDITLRMVGKPALAKELYHASTHIIGIGLRGANPHDSKCWLYFPEPNSPFYRATVFSHYAAKNCPPAGSLLPTVRRAGGHSEEGDDAPRGGPWWSLMFEVSESSYKPVDLARIVEQTIQGAINVNLCKPGDEIVSIYHRRIEHGYPTPHVKRDAVLEQALPFLRDNDVWSRGRFGSYKYEVGNQDHSMMLGVEAADNMMHGSKEFTLDHPSLANARGAKASNNIRYNDAQFDELQTW